MIAKLITFSAHHRFLILLATCFAIVGGVVALQHTPLDALPDLSDVQVIVYTEWPERSPTLVEDQVTYPMVTSLLSAPKVQVVRGYSFFGASFVYVIFQDGTDLYWARSRVLEYLSGMAGKLPPGVAPPTSAVRSISLHRSARMPSVAPCPAMSMTVIARCPSRVTNRS